MNPEGLDNYVVPPPAHFIAPPENEVPCETPEPANPEPDIQDVEPTEPPEDDPQEDRVDSEENRNFEHENVGKKIKALYDNGWHIGEIKYFSNDLQEYKIYYPDGSVDYISPEDIDGLEVFFV